MSSMRSSGCQVVGLSRCGPDNPTTSIQQTLPPLRQELPQIPRADPGFEVAIVFEEIAKFRRADELFERVFLVRGLVFVCLLAPAEVAPHLANDLRRPQPGAVRLQCIAIGNVE